jgi:hypothetical protein
MAPNVSARIGIVPSSRPNHESQLSDGDEAHETARLDRRRDQALDGASAPEEECAGHCEAAWTLHSFRQKTRASIGLPSAAKQRWPTALNLEGTAIMIGASCARGRSDGIWAGRKVTWNWAPTGSWSRRRSKSLETPKILLGSNLPREGGVTSIA